MDERIAREPPRRLGVELIAADRLAAADGFTRERRVIDDHDHVRPVRAAVLVVEVVPEDVDDRVGALLRRRSRVVRLMVAFVAAPQRGVDDLRAFGVEGAVEDPDPVE